MKRLLLNMLIVLISIFAGLASSWRVITEYKAYQIEHVAPATDSGCHRAVCKT